MAGYLPTTNDDQAAQQLAASFFFTAAGLLAGTDTTLRIDPNQQRTDGLLGPVGSTVSLGVGNGGELYVRGSPGQFGTTSAAPSSSGSPPASGVAGITLTPGLLMLAVVAFLVLRR